MEERVPYGNPGREQQAHEYTYVLQTGERPVRVSRDPEKIATFLREQIGDVPEVTNFVLDPDALGEKGLRVYNTYVITKVVLI